MTGKVGRFFVKIKQNIFTCTLKCYMVVYNNQYMYVCDFNLIQNMVIH